MTDVECGSIQNMELETLRTLSEKDKQTFLLGRIASETTRMDAALRIVNAALRGQRDVDAYLDAPNFFSTNIRACRELLKDHPGLADETRAAVRGTLSAGSKAYTRRNRYIHDLLRKDLLDASWELAPLSRQAESAPVFETVSFDEMVALVREIVAVTWRLRGSAMHILQGTWEGMTFGAVDGAWDGSASYIR